MAIILYKRCDAGGTSVAVSIGQQKIPQSSVAREANGNRRDETVEKEENPKTNSMTEPVEKYCARPNTV